MCRGSWTYRQIPGSLLRGSVYTGRGDIWECLLERCGAGHVFPWGWSAPARSSPSPRPTSAKQHGTAGSGATRGGTAACFHTHQLDVVDALVGELLQGSPGALLQGEGQALQRLRLAVHADLGLHLQGEAKPRKSIADLQAPGVTIKDEITVSHNC